MRILKRALAAFAIVLAIGVTWLLLQLRSSAVTQPFLPPSAALPRVTFLGVSTLLVDDGETALMTDGFFTRPSKFAVLGKIAPDRDAIARQLARARVEKLAAVIVAHSHYDHAMDAPEVARRTGAMVVGSESTANVARGWGLPESQIRVVRDGDALVLGKFRVLMLKGRHIDHGVAMGTIDRPLQPPARASDYQEGGSWSILVEREGKSILIQGSAGFVEGALAGRRAGTVFLGVGMLGKKDAAYREAYFREVVRAVGARRVIPIHWDDFTLPLDEPLRALPPLFDDFAATMKFLAAQKEVEVGLLNSFDSVQFN